MQTATSPVESWRSARVALERARAASGAAAAKIRALGAQIRDFEAHDKWLDAARLREEIAAETPTATRLEAQANSAAVLERHQADVARRAVIEAYLPVLDRSIDATAALLEAAAETTRWRQAAASDGSFQALERGDVAGDIDLGELDYLRRWRELALKRRVVLARLVGEPLDEH